MPPGIDPKNGGFGDKQGLVRPRPLIEAARAPSETNETAADTYDARVHMASDNADVLLHAEEALWGGNDEGRTPAEIHGDVEGPTDPDHEYGDHPAAELSTGFNDLYRNSVPRETSATVLEDQQLVEAKPPGIFAQGTVTHVSKLDTDIEDWYENNDLEERRARMFSPQHTAENTGAVGENLGNSNAPGEKPMRDVSASSRARTNPVSSTRTSATRSRGRTRRASSTTTARGTRTTASCRT
jgi:hypothetical protein